MPKFIYTDVFTKNIEFTASNPYKLLLIRKTIYQDSISAPYCHERIQHFSFFCFFIQPVAIKKPTTNFL